eukprot:6181172-Amphidinium_carterae.2
MSEVRPMIARNNAHVLTWMSENTQHKGFAANHSMAARAPKQCHMKQHFQMSHVLIKPVSHRDILYNK